MTVKSRSVKLTCRYSTTQSTALGGAIPSVGGTYTLTRTRDGVSNPGWRQQIAAQQNATTPMTGTFDDYVSDPPGGSNLWRLQFYSYALYPYVPRDWYCWIERRGDFGALDCSATPNINWGVTIVDTTASNRALISFLKKVRSVQVGFSSPTFLGELRQTLGMIHRPAEGIRNILRNYLKDAKRLKGTSRTPKQWKKNLSSAWLEAVFGMVPLASDIQNAYKSYDANVRKNDSRQVPVSGFGKDSKSVPSRSGVLIGSPVLQGRAYADLAYNAEESCVARLKGMVVRRVDATLRDKLARQGFTWDEFVPTAWELLPWSFLVDYFSNIGDVLTAGVADRSSIAWNNQTVITFQEVRGMSTPNVEKTRAFYDQYDCFISFTGRPASYHTRRRFVNRKQLISLPDAQLSFELPSYVGQFANMTALFTQAYAVHPQRYKGRF